MISLICDLLQQKIKCVKIDGDNRQHIPFSNFKHYLVLLLVYIFYVTLYNCHKSKEMITVLYLTHFVHKMYSIAYIHAFIFVLDPLICITFN